MFFITDSCITLKHIFVEKPLLPVIARHPLTTRHFRYILSFTFNIITPSYLYTHPPLSYTLRCRTPKALTFIFCCLFPDMYALTFICFVFLDSLVCGLSWGGNKLFPSPYRGVHGFVHYVVGGIRWCIHVIR